MTEPADPSLRHLSGRLSVVEARVAAAVARCRGGDPGVMDRFQGLFLSSVSLDRLLAVRRTGTGEVEPEIVEFLDRVEVEADGAEAAGGDLRLRRLARSFGLDAYDTEVLLVALAPDLDPRFERF
ncbi:MAG: ATP-binding protein, partial [Acidimicrobiia bacterium]